MTADDTVIDQPDPSEPKPNQDLTKLASYVKLYMKGQRVFEQGDDGDTMYFIQQGRVRITKIAKNRTQPLALLEAGSFFGEMALFSGEPRTARADAIEDSALLEIDKSTLDEFLGAHPNVALRMIRVLSERLRNTDILVERLLAGDPVIQVVETMLVMTRNSEEQFPVIADIQELMVKSGTDPRLLRWVLSRLKQAKFIRIDDEGIRIIARPRMEQYLNFLGMQRDILTPKKTA